MAVRTIIFRGKRIDNGEYILKNIFNCDIIQLKNNSNIGVFVDEI